MCRKIALANQQPNKDENTVELEKLLFGMYIIFIFRISSSIDITVKNSYIKTWEDLNWAYYSMKVDLCLFDSIKKKSSIV